MPTYRYRCDAGHVFEAVQSIRDEPLPNCTIDLSDEPNCSAPVQRVIGAPSVIWVGGAPTKKFHDRG